MLRNEPGAHGAAAADPPPGAQGGLPAKAPPSTLQMFLMRSPFVLAGALASLAAVLGGCVAPPDDRPDAEATSATATAIVVVERTSGPGDAIRGDAVIARFVRVRQGTVDDQALRIAGVASDLPALGTCSTVQEVQPALQPRSVDLLDVGVLTLDAPVGKSTVLLPRSMPDPTGVVSGVFYSARSAEGFAPSSRLQLHASGGSDLADGFRIDVPSPRDVSDVRVSSSATGLDVTWEAETIPNDSRDVVYVDVLGPSSRLLARCTTLDVGQLSIPLPPGAAAEGQLSVHRLHSEGFRAKGIEPGEVRFDVARIVTFRR